MIPTNKYKKYQKYKPSGVEWLGDVPAHWEVNRLKNAANYWVSNVDKVPVDDEHPVRLCNYTDVYYNDFISSDMELMQTTATIEEIKKFHLEVDDVVITKDSEEWDDIAISALVTKTAPEMICGYHLAMIRPIRSKLSGKYLSRQFQSTAINHQFQILATGVTRYGLPKSAIGEAIIPLPPLPEQQAIAAFLDQQTGTIDTLIARKQQLIELLKEKRTAVISKAVTKGLFDLVHPKDPDFGQWSPLHRSSFIPNPSYKPSGVEWLGDIPKHWEVKSLKYICNIQTGDKDTVDAIDDGDYPLFVRSQTIERINSYTFDCEAVLTAGDGVGVGKVFHYINGKFDFHQRVYMFNNFKKIIGIFFFYFLRENFWRVAFDGGAKSTVDSLRRPMISGFSILIPPLHEQQAIAEYLDRETAKIDLLVSKVETAIEKLKEYRTALISAAVTGKISVKG